MNQDRLVMVLCALEQDGDKDWYRKVMLPMPVEGLGDKIWKDFLGHLDEFGQLTYYSSDVKILLILRGPTDVLDYHIIQYLRARMWIPLQQYS